MQLPKGTSTKGPVEMFTGDVYFDVIVKGEEPSRMRVNTGIGLVQSRGDDVMVTRPGMPYRVNS